MKRIAPSILAVLLGACATLAPPPPAPPESTSPPVRYVPVRSPSAVDRALLYVEKVQTMDPAQRRQELARLERELASGAGDSVRLYRALLLIWTARGRDAVAAQRQALAEVRPEAFGDDAPQVAALLATLDRCLAEGAARLSQSNKAWARRVAEQERRIRGLEEERRRLQAQIDALKAIERSIQQRMSPP